MKQINNISIDTTPISNSGGVKTLSISGDIGAKFKVQIQDSSSPVKFYDFITETFVVGNNYAAQFLTGNLNNRSFNHRIIFPASGTSYKILLHADVLSGTFISPSVSTDSMSWSTDLDQSSSNINVVFTPITTHTNNFASMPTSVTSSAPVSSTNQVTETINWTIASAASDTYGYGIKIDADFVSGDETNKTLLTDGVFYFTPTLTYTIEESISDSNSVIIDNVTDLAPGMYITAVTGGSELSGEPIVTYIEAGSGELQLDTEQTFTAGNTLTFQARRPNVIKNAIGLDLSPTAEWSYIENLIRKTVKTAPTNEDIDLNGSRGISAGSTVSGLNVNNEETNLVQSVSLGATTTGSVTMQLDQTGVTVGTILTFTGSTDSVELVGTITINKYPDVSRIIYMNLDKFTNIGTQTP